MKRTPILLAALLALAAFSHADTINLTSGSGTIGPRFVAPGYTFVFNGGGYHIDIPIAMDDFVGRLVNGIGWTRTHFDPGPLFLGSGHLVLGGRSVHRRSHQIRRCLVCFEPCPQRYLDG